MRSKVGPTQAELEAAFAAGQAMGRDIVAGVSVLEIKRTHQRPDLRTTVGKRFDAGVKSALHARGNQP